VCDDRLTVFTILQNELFRLRDRYAAYTGQWQLGTYVYGAIMDSRNSALKRLQANFGRIITGDVKAANRASTEISGSSVKSASAGNAAEEVLKRYFANLKHLSQPAEGIVDPDAWFLGNETITRENIFGIGTGTAVKDKGGIFVGTGCGMALEYIFHSGAEEAYIVDYNVLVTEMFWPILFALYTQNPDRLNFIGELLSMDFTPRQRREFQDKGIWDIIITAREKNKPSREKYEASIRRFTRLLKPHASEQLKGELSRYIRRFFFSFLVSRQQLRFGFPDADYATFAMISNLQASIDSLGGTLSSQESYEKMRGMILSNGIKVATGDFTKKGLDRVADEIRSQNKEVSLLYTSNAQAAVLVDKKAKPYRRMFDNFLKLPMLESAVVLYAVYGTENTPNLTYPDFVSIASILSLPSRHNLLYKAVLHQQVMNLLAHFNNQAMPLANRVGELSHAFDEVVRILKPDNVRISRTSKRLFDIFRFPQAYPYSMGRFKDRKALNRYLSKKGIVGVDQFDYEIVCRSLEAMGVIQKAVKSSSAGDGNKQPKVVYKIKDPAVALKQLGIKDDPYSRTIFSAGHRVELRIGSQA
jgi:hypothetical protein